MDAADLAKMHRAAVDAVDSFYHASLELLQEACPHQDQTGWLIGPTMDLEVRICSKCHKEMERRHRRA